MSTALGPVADGVERAGKTTGSEAASQYLTFRQGGELFAMALVHVKEILEYGGLTQVPMMPSFVRGVINLRGRVVPIIDLSVRFDRDPSVPGRRTCVVILEVPTDGAKQDIGIIVDAVNQVLDIPVSDIEPPPTFGTKLRADFISGMAKVNGSFIVLLDVAHVLSVDEMAQFDGMPTSSH